MRTLTAEHVLTPADLIWSLIIHDGEAARVPIESMPGISRLNVDEAAKAATRAQALVIPAIAIFPNISPARKDDAGSESLNQDELVPRAIRTMKADAPNVGYHL